MGTKMTDEIDCGNFFDQIDDLIDFPPDNEIGDDSKLDFTSMWTDALPESDSIFSGGHGSSAPDLSAELSVPYEDIVQLEWLSTFVEDSFSGGGMTLAKENSFDTKEPLIYQFQTSSPVSVLESSSSSSTSACSIEKTITPLSPNHRGPQRARSKRPRPATFNPRAAIPSFIETPHPFITSSAFSSESEDFLESPPVKKIPEQKKKKKTKTTTSPPLDRDETHHPDHTPAQQAVRKCMHCEITKTPQWRAGPTGPKSLCNACGVRYKSGRLFPEYRPAASPTFVPALHSNSHKKVLEMRGKGGPATTETLPTTTKPEFVPNM